MSVFVSEVDGSTELKKKKKYKTKYNLKYELDYPWVGPSPKGETYALCKWCNVSVCIGSVGAKGLRDHETTARHKRTQIKIESQVPDNSHTIQAKSTLANDKKINDIVPQQSTSDTIVQQEHKSSLLSSMNHYQSGTHASAPIINTSNIEISSNTGAQLIHMVTSDNTRHVLSQAMPTPQVPPHPSCSLVGSAIIATSFSHNSLPTSNHGISGAVYPVLEAEDGGDHQIYPSPQSPQTPNTPSSPQQDNVSHYSQTHMQLKQEITSHLPQSLGTESTSCLITNASNGLCSNGVDFDYDSSQPTLQTLADTVSLALPKLVSEQDTCTSTSITNNGPASIPAMTEMNKIELDTNNKTTTENDDLKCDVCGLEFPQWTMLKKHLVNHINDIKGAQSNETPRGIKSAKINRKNVKSIDPTIKSTSKAVVRRRGRPAVLKKKSKQILNNCSIESEEQVSVSPSNYNRSLRQREKPLKYQDDDIFPDQTESPIKLKDVSSDESLLSSPAPQPSEDILENSQFLLSTDASSSPSIVPPMVPEKKMYPLQCRVCRMVFYDRNDLKQHQIVDHNNGKPYCCNICNRYFTTKNNLEVHTKYKHEQGPDPCRCNICNKVLSSRTNLRIHMKIHKGDKPFQCSFCQKRFSRKLNMEMHIVYHTRERRYTCEICGQSFFAINALKRHTKLHTGERDYTCDVCGAAYITGTDLRRHRLKHDDIKPFPCNLCEKQFTRAHDLKVHLRYHNKDLRFTCDVCQKQFVEVGNYKRHIRRHTGERPYNCQICPLTFSQVHHLKTHMRTAHSEESTGSTGVNSQNRASSTLKSFRAFQGNNKKEVKSLQQLQPVQLSVTPACVQSGHMLPPHHTHVPNQLPSSTIGNSSLFNPVTSTMSSPVAHVGATGTSGILPPGATPVATSGMNSSTMPSFMQYNNHLYNHYSNIFDMCPQQPTVNHDLTHQSH